MVKIDLMVDGGKASAGPQVGQVLGPLKINIANVLAKVNEKTKAFAGMKVPVTLDVDEKTKDFTIEVGTPPTSELIKKEINLQKGSGLPDKEKKANLAVEQVIKIAQMKKDSMYSPNLKSAVKSVAGTCNSMGLLVEGKTGSEFCQEVDEGKYNSEIEAGKTNVPPEKTSKLKKQLEEVKASLAKELEKIKKAEAAEEKPKEAVAEEAKEGEAPAEDEKPKEEASAEEKKE